MKDMSDDYNCYDERCKRRARWYFGGIASCTASIFTTPLDLLKVHLQTQQQEQKGLLRVTALVIKNHGIQGLYMGLTAGILRQMTYAMTRFGVYEHVKHSLHDGQEMTFLTKIATAGFSGFLGMMLGAPADLVNVRMQNDAKLPPETRRGYRNGLEGLYRVAKEEGVRTLYRGASMACVRAVLITIGQLAFYDQIKTSILEADLMKDGVSLHIFSSFSAAVISVLITQPFDVMKTRMMNATPGKYKNMLECAYHTAHHGVRGFYKGTLPSFLRLGPFTIITFVVFEQLRLNFGIDPSTP